MNWVRNKHGVEGLWSSIGSCFERVVLDKVTHEVLERELNAPMFVPRCCLECEHYDGGEYGEYGTLLSGPTCNLFI